MAMTCVSVTRECDGCMSCLPEQQPSPICPVCDKETDTFYFDKGDEIVGCSECVSTKDAWEVAGCA
ncbi:MAG: hypothetical protein FWE19_00395 [Oscillospiraceae bacterium]|nr:hypothetical protein [Oscillospiraceae bacterium]